LAIATNAHRAITIQSLKSLGILYIFDDIVCGDDVTEAKPNPQMLFKILESLEKQPEEAIFVGDGERDMLASERAKIDFILVNWGFDNHKSGVESAEELEERIKNLCK
jgi:phosphoglycolate phosphatase